MKKSLFLIVFSVMCVLSSAQAASKRSNYVVFNVKGDCNLEDCIAVVRDALHDPSLDIVSLEATSLAEHQSVDYKAVIITFKSLDNPQPPYQEVMERIGATGYNVVSYVIHDLHTGQNIIIPH